MSEKWEEWDKPIYFVHNWTDGRQAIEFHMGGKTGWIMPNNSIPANKDEWVTG